MWTTARVLLVPAAAFVAVSFGIDDRSVVSHVQLRPFTLPFRTQESAPMPLELVSFPICPFVQRSVIALLHKGAEFKLTYIDLANKPAWFLAISPLGKVPVLRLDDDTVLFESAAINEYLDETTAPRLMPEDPVERARARAWIAFASTLQADLMTVMLAPTEAQLAEAEATMSSHLLQLEQGTAPNPYFLADRFSLVDATVAPVFSRLAWLARRRPVPRWNEMPRLTAWSATLLALPAVRDSVPPDFEQALEAFLRARASLVATMEPTPRPEA